MIAFKVCWPHPGGGGSDGSAYLWRACVMMCRIHNDACGSGVSAGDVAMQEPPVPGTSALSSSEAVREEPRRAAQDQARSSLPGGHISQLAGFQKPPFGKRTHMGLFKMFTREVYTKFTVFMGSVYLDIMHHGLQQGSETPYDSCALVFMKSCVILFNVFSMSQRTSGVLG